MRQTQHIGGPPGMCWAIGVLLALACASACAAQPATDSSGTPPSAVHIVHPPAGAIAPDVVIDSAGIVHMVYGFEAARKDAFYVRSSDNGRTWSRPLKINGDVEVTTTMGERGPKLALGPDGIIHVAWMDKWFPGAHELFVRHARSRDGGKTFDAPSALSSPRNGDGVTIAADTSGNVAVFWHVMNPVQTIIPEATWLYVANSSDGGATFRPEARITIAGLQELACSMCMMRARATADGTVFLAYRTAVDNIRDFYVLRGRMGGTQFTPLRVNEDRWELKTCPMCGPELTFSADGRALCAFMSRHRVYWAIADAKMRSFKLHVATPAPEDDEIYPSAVANRAGQVLMVWQVGPMSVSAKATVKWALYSADGTATGQHATIGVSSSGTKPAAFIGADDHFYIVTTAR